MNSWQENKDQKLSAFCLHFLSQVYPVLSVLYTAVPIHLPPLEIQCEIVEEIEGCQRITDGARKLIEIYEEKIKQVIARVWEG